MRVGKFYCTYSRLQHSCENSRSRISISVIKFEARLTEDNWRTDTQGEYDYLKSEVKRALAQSSLVGSSHWNAAPNNHIPAGKTTRRDNDETTTTNHHGHSQRSSGKGIYYLLLHGCTQAPLLRFLLLTAAPACARDRNAGGCFTAAAGRCAFPAGGTHPRAAVAGVDGGGG